MRTLADLAATRPANEVAGATEGALACRLIRPEDLPKGTAPTRSELERRCFTHRQITREPLTVIARLAAVLSR